MPTYRYEVKSPVGKIVQGVLNAASLTAASNELRGRGQYILHLAPAVRSNQKKGFNFSIQLGPSAKDIRNFTTQLAVMIRAGISIRSAIEGIAEQAVNPKFKKMLEQMKQDVESGKQFSESLARYPKVFSPLYLNMVKASELSGGFSKMLDRVAGYLTQQIETRGMVIWAMVYPGIIAPWPSAPPSSSSPSFSRASWSSSKATSKSFPFPPRGCWPFPDSWSTTGISFSPSPSARSGRCLFSSRPTREEGSSTTSS